MPFAQERVMLRRRGETNGLLVDDRQQTGEGERTMITFARAQIRSSAIFS
jgi:hypothetical protein